MYGVQLRCYNERIGAVLMVMNAVRTNNGRQLSAYHQALSELIMAIQTKKRTVWEYASFRLAAGTCLMFVLSTAICMRAIPH